MKIKDFLLGVNNHLQEEGLKFVVIRNYEELPETNIGNDIDVIVKKKSIPKWLDILKTFCDQNNLEFKIERQHRYVVATKITGVEDKNGELKLDLNNFLNWRGVDFYQTDNLVKNSQLYKTPIFTANREYINWYITFCHSFLYGGFINSKYVDRYKMVLDNYQEEFTTLLRSVFTQKETNYLIEKIKSDDFYIPRYKANIIRLSLLLRYFIRKPVYTSYNFFLSYFPYSS
jgi:hypothetical protein